MACSPALVLQVAAPHSGRTAETKVRQRTDKGHLNTKLLLSLPLKSNQRQKKKKKIKTTLAESREFLLLSLIERLL